MPMPAGKQKEIWIQTGFELQPVMIRECTTERGIIVLCVFKAIQLRCL